MKNYLSTTPILSAPEDGEELFLYLAISKVAVSAILVKEGNKKHKTSLLYEQDVVGCRDKIHWSREDGSSLGNYKEKAQTLLWISPGHIGNELSNQTNSLKARSFRKVKEMGNWNGNLWDEVYPDNKKK